MPRQRPHVRTPIRRRRRLRPRPPIVKHTISADIWWYDEPTGLYLIVHGRQVHLRWPVLRRVVKKWQR